VKLASAAGSPELDSLELIGHPRISRREILPGEGIPSIEVSAPPLVADY
jgi:hypothetical protein